MLKNKKKYQYPLSQLIVDLIDIRFSLHQLYPQNKDVIEQWIYTKKKVFGNKSAWDLIKTKPDGLLRVLTYLRCARQI